MLDVQCFTGNAVFAPRDGCGATSVFGDSVPSTRVTPLSCPMPNTSNSTGYFHSKRLKLQHILGVPTDIGPALVKKKGLGAALSSNVPLSYFLLFLLKTHSSELLCFYLDVESLESAEMPLVELQRAVRQIYSTYIEPDSFLEINLDQCTRELVRDRMLEFTARAANDAVNLNDITSINEIMPSKLIDKRISRQLTVETVSSISSERGNGVAAIFDAAKKHVWHLLENSLASFMRTEPFLSLLSMNQADCTILSDDAQREAIAALQKHVDNISTRSESTKRHKVHSQNLINEFSKRI